MGLICRGRWMACGDFRSWHMPRICTLLICLTFCPFIALAQDSDRTPDNVGVLSDLARSCVPETSNLDPIALVPPSRLPFLRSAMVAELQSRGTNVLAQPDSGAALLEMDLERAGVAYESSGGGMVDRTISLALDVRLIDAEGVVRHDETCSPVSTDRVRRRSITDLEDPAYPETRGVAPLSIWRRAVQPAVITLATAAGTVLFFSLRSRRSDGS